MNHLSAYLTADHDHCDHLFADAENAVSANDWAKAETEFARFRSATRRHFAREENVLFPAFEAATGTTAGPTSVMRAEHDQVRATLQAMADALSARNAAGYLGYAETLLMLLRQHNLKEQQILYPMSDRLLAGQVEGLLSGMQTVAA